MAKRKALLAIFILLGTLLLISTVSAVVDTNPPTFENLTITPRIVNSGGSVTINFNVSDDLSGFKIGSVQWNGPQGGIWGWTIGESLSELPLVIDISPYMQSGTYWIDINLMDKATNARTYYGNSDFDGEFIVNNSDSQNGYCNDGPHGNITLTIEEPSENDIFYVGDSVKLKLKVRNTVSSEQNVTIDADFYDLTTGEYLDEGNETSLTISEGMDAETVFLNITIPSDIDDSHQYAVYAKAFEDGAEDTNCAEASQSVQIQRKLHDIEIAEFTIDPATVDCGSQIDARITLENLGSVDESVSLRVYNTALGVSYIRLEDLEMGDTIQIFQPIVVPLNATEGWYTLDAEASYDYDDSTGEYRRKYVYSAYVEVNGANCENFDPNKIYVHSVTMLNAVAIPDNNYSNGWNYTFVITVPANESKITFRMADWRGLFGGSIPVNNNTIVVYNGANYSVGSAPDYSQSTPFTVTDMDSNYEGIQAIFNVLVKLPESTNADSYWTGYFIKSEQPQ